MANLKFRRPEYIPAEHRAFVMKYSKADLAEMVWDYAVRMVGDGEFPDGQRVRNEIATTAAAVYHAVPVTKERRRPAREQSA